MITLTGILKRLGLLPPWSEDERINASTEDALREHSKTVVLARDLARKRQEGNEALRKSIHIARERATSFGSIERRIRRR